MSEAKSKVKNYTADTEGSQIESAFNSISSHPANELRVPFSRLVTYSQLVIICIVAFSVYLNALFNGFVWDDSYQIQENLWLRDIRYLPDIFLKDVWGFWSASFVSSYYRPMMHLINMISYHVFGQQAWGFHLVNMLFHVGNCVLVFIITLRLPGMWTESLPITMTEKKMQGLMSPAFIAALLFATHPIHTEAVTWAAALPEISFAFFSLLSFYFFAEFQQKFRGMSIVSVAAFLFALLCKETALTLIPLLVIYTLLFSNSERRLVTLWKGCVPYLIVAGIYFILRYHALSGMIPSTENRGLSLYLSIINIFPLLTEYLYKLLLPVNLNFWHAFNPITSLLSVKGASSLFTTIVCVCSALFAAKKDKTVFFALTLLLVPLLPAFYIEAIPLKPFAERYLYLPSVGFVMLLALFAVRSMKKIDKRIITAIIILIVGLYAIGTYTRNYVWKDDITLFTDAVVKSPNVSQPHEYLGHALLRQGFEEEGVRQLRIALELNPELLQTTINRGVSLSIKGATMDAILYLNNAVILKPDSVDAHYNLALAYEQMGMLNDAIKHYMAALSIQPNNSYIHNNLGNAYARKGLIDSAIGHFEMAINLNPTEPSFRQNLDNLINQKNAAERGKR